MGRTSAEQSAGAEAASDVPERDRRSVRGRRRIGAQGSVHPRHGGQQLAGIGRCRTREDAADGAGFHQFAVPHDGDAIGHLGDDAHVVGDQEQAGPDLPGQLAHQLEDLGLHRHVQGRRRLVGDQEFRFERHRHGDHHALAHAAGGTRADTASAGAAHRRCRPLSASPPPLPGPRPATGRDGRRGLPSSGGRSSAPASGWSSVPGRSSPCGRRGRAGGRHRRARRSPYRPAGCDPPSDARGAAAGPSAPGR